MLDFLPDFPLPPNQLVLFGAVLLVGFIGGHLANQLLRLPRITGYVGVGVLLGHNGLNWLNAESLANLRIFADIAFGLILFELGRRLNYRWLKTDRRLLLTALAECLASFAAIYWVLQYFGIAPLYAGAAAAIGIATSPAVLMLVAHDLRADGQVTNRALEITAINNGFAFVVFTMLFSYLHFEYQAGWTLIVLHPLYLLFGSILLGYFAGIAAIRISRSLGKHEEWQFITLVATIVLTIGIAGQFKLSLLIALLVFGLVVRNLDRKHTLLPIEFGYGAPLFLVMLFVFAGASLQLETLAEVGWLAPVYILARFAGKFLATFSLAHLNGISFKQGGLLGVALVPMSGTAIFMTQSANLAYPEFGAKLSAIVLSAVALLEIIGPLMAQAALVYSGEAASDKH